MPGCTPGSGRLPPSCAATAHPSSPPTIAATVAEAVRSADVGAVSDVGGLGAGIADLGAGIADLGAGILRNVVPATLGGLAL
jgi:hypothetical protein